MSRARGYETEAIVLRTVPFGETSQVVHLATPEHGMVAALAKGARAETLMGLSGLGDLVLTCNAMQSRNFSFGVAVGEGARPADVLAGRQAVTEGALSASAVAELARRQGIEMPITHAVDAVINQGADLDRTITGLLTRPFKGEGLG